MKFSKTLLRLNFLNDSLLNRFLVLQTGNKTFPSQFNLTAEHVFVFIVKVINTASYTFKTLHRTLLSTV